MSAQFIKDKAREISYALIRVAFYIKREDLHSRLESLAVELMENSARISADNNLANTNQALASVSVLDGLVRLAHSIYEIEPVNATILIRELDKLDSAIRQFGNNQIGVAEQLPDLETFFKVKPDQDKYPESNQELKTNSNGNNNGNGNGNGINTAIRQSAIINRIKSGNGNGCRLKDLLAEFTDVSERTLRYDLQRLCEQGIIERAGNGGPSSYYRSAGGVELKPSVTPIS